MSPKVIHIVAHDRIALFFKTKQNAIVKKEILPIYSFFNEHSSFLCYVMIVENVEMNMRVQNIIDTHF